jgi:hypothetical protein
MWLLRAVVIIVLFIQCLWMLTAAGLPIALLFESETVRPALESLSGIASEVVNATTAWEVGLALAVLFFFILALVRLVRRTRAFVAWLFGFVCLLGLRALQGIAPDLGQEPLPELANRAAANFLNPDLVYFNGVVLALSLVIGVAILFIDLSDDRHWNAYESEAV